MSTNLNLITLFKKCIDYRFGNNKFYIFHFTKPLSGGIRIQSLSTTFKVAKRITEQYSVNLLASQCVIYMILEDTNYSKPTNCKL